MYSGRILSDTDHGDYGTFRKDKVPLASTSEDNSQDDEDGVEEESIFPPLASEMPDNPNLVNIPQQTYYDALLLSGYRDGNYRISTPTSTTSLTSLAILPTSLLLPLHVSPSSLSSLTSLHRTSWSAHNEKRKKRNRTHS